MSLSVELSETSLQSSGDDGGAPQRRWWRPSAAMVVDGTSTEVSSE